MKKILFAALLLLMPLFFAGAQGLTPVIPGQSEDTYYDNQIEDEVFGTLTRRGGRLFLNGEILSRKDAKLVLGPQLFNETYKGARRQCRTANTLCTVGVLGILSGVGAMVLSEVGRDDYLENGPGEFTLDDYDALEGVGYLAVLTGAACINLCIPFASIGKSRLAWICDDYNERSNSSAYTMNIGLQKHGYGLAINF